MSADNCIAVLVLTDGYRVIHAGAINNLWWTNLPVLQVQDKPVSTRVFEYFKDADLVFTKEDMDMRIELLYLEVGYFEYGVVKINMMPYCWDNIVEMAKIQIEKELGYELSLDKPKFAEELYQTKLDLYGVNDD
jgi:hypothetical protein